MCVCVVCVCVCVCVREGDWVNLSLCDASECACVNECRGESPCVHQRCPDYGYKILLNGVIEKGQGGGVNLCVHTKDAPNTWAL